MFEKETLELYQKLKKETIKNIGPWRHSSIENWKVDYFPNILLETHYDPEHALGADSVQTIDFDTFHKTVAKARRIYELIKKDV